MASYGRWAPYVPVAQRRAKAEREAKSMAKKGQKLRPIQIPGRNIATSFWGAAWCQNLEKYSDWANRMPRGRSYARNGSIIDLQIVEGKITSLVSGSEVYRIQVTVEKINPNTWKAIRRDCASKVGSLIDLMRGKLPEDVMKRLTSQKDGMFPSPNEIKIQCSCPDRAVMCKHAAATLYGVGHLLDSEPELFFLMRGVSRTDLIGDAIKTQKQSDPMGLDAQSTLDGDDLGALFGIDLATAEDSAGTADPKSKRKTTARSGTKKPPGKKATKKKTSDSRSITPVAKPKAAIKKAATKKPATKTVVQRKTSKKPTAATNVKVKRSAAKQAVPKPKAVIKVAIKKVATKKTAAKKGVAKKVAIKKAVRK